MNKNERINENNNNNKIKKTCPVRNPNKYNNNVSFVESQLEDTFKKVEKKKVFIQFEAVALTPRTLHSKALSRPIKPGASPRIQPFTSCYNSPWPLFAKEFLQRRHFLAQFARENISSFHKLQRVV